MKKILLILLILATVMILMACSPPQTAQSNPGIQIHEKSHKLVDGRRAICLYTESVVVGGYASTRSIITDIECEIPPRTK
jgi:protein involved in sex pheromone biosynthesis